MDREFTISYSIKFAPRHIVQGILEFFDQNVHYVIAHCFPMDTANDIFDAFTSLSAIHGASSVEGLRKAFQVVIHRCRRCRLACDIGWSSPYYFGSYFEALPGGISRWR
jgi:hypothetical protein